jgi:HEAT repeat protein
MANRATDSKSPSSPAAPTATSGASRATLDQAFEALRAYDTGSGRGALEPIDRAVIEALADARAREKLGRRLAGVLKTGASRWAKEYVCSKLRLLGSAVSVPALASLLRDPTLTDAARSALQAMTCPEATRVLRDAVATLTGPPRIGVIDSLGKHRDARSVAALARLLESPDAATATAAAGALGEVGTGTAASALRRFLARGPESMRREGANAGLVCAERLNAAGNHAEALEICRLLTGPACPQTVQDAAARMLGRAPQR